jgi:hypothetical protein
MKTRAWLGLVLVAAIASTLSHTQHLMIPQETEMRVKLLSPISTETSKKGDKITAEVLSPDQYRNYFMEGQIRESKGGKSKSTLSFYFDTFENPERSAKTHVKSSIKSLVNSQGKENVDEEGNVIKKTNNLGKAAAITGAGALIGALAGGGRGAAIGAGAGAAAALVFIEVGVQAPKVTFAPCSEFIMTVDEK